MRVGSGRHGKRVGSPAHAHTCKYIQYPPAFHTLFSLSLSLTHIFRTLIHIHLRLRTRACASVKCAQPSGKSINRKMAMHMFEVAPKSCLEFMNGVVSQYHGIP